MPKINKKEAPKGFYAVAEAKDLDCEGCDMWSLSQGCQSHRSNDPQHYITCVSAERDDRKNVIFKKSHSKAKPLRRDDFNNNSWHVIEVFDTDVPGLYELLENDCADSIHSTFKDMMVRFGDDGGWCVDAVKGSKLYNYLERVRKLNDLPNYGWVFYLVVKRS